MRSTTFAQAIEAALRVNDAVKGSEDVAATQAATDTFFEAHARFTTAAVALAGTRVTAVANGAEVEPPTR